MKPDEVVVRLYEADDASPLLGFPFPGCVGFTALIGGRVAGFGAIHPGGGALWAVLVLYDEQARRPFLLHRLARKLLTGCDGPEWRPLLAACDSSNERARKWLNRLGFVATGQTLGDWAKARVLPLQRQVDHALEIWRKD